MLRENNVRNHRITMDKDTVYLSNLGMFENKTTDKDGIIETRYVEINGGSEVEKMQEDPKQKTKTYYLKSGNIQIGDKILFD